MNGHIIGFRPQTQKLESPYKTPSNTLAVTGYYLFLAPVNLSNDEDDSNEKGKKTKRIIGYVHIIPDIDIRSSSIV